MQNDEFAVDDIVLLVECGAVPAVLGLLSKVLLDGKCVVRTAVEKMSAAVNLAVNTGDAYKSFAWLSSLMMLLAVISATVLIADTN